eukprot:7022229-Prymnesium_polylepis.1
MESAPTLRSHRLSIALSEARAPPPPGLAWWRQSAGCCPPSSEHPPSRQLLAAHRPFPYGRRTPQ